jgi:hypothetical protein
MANAAGHPLFHQPIKSVKQKRQAETLFGFGLSFCTQSINSLRQRGCLNSESLAAPTAFRFCRVASPIQFVALALL